MADSFYFLKDVNGDLQIQVDREIIAGRDLTCDLTLIHGGASRKHAKMNPVAEGIVVEDLGSTNGVFVNDERIAVPTLVKAGDTIQIGDTQLMLMPLVVAEPAPVVVDPDATIMYAPKSVSTPAAAQVETLPVEAAKVEEPKVEAPKILEPKIPEPKVEPLKAASPEPSPPTPENVANASKAPPSWVLNDHQSVDGTRLVARDQEPVVVNESVIERASVVTVTEPTLMGVSEPFLGMRFQLIGEQKNQWEIGRSPQSDVMINHESVSSTHAQMIRDGVRWKIVDLMSANGTFINGKKCLTGYLENRNVIRLGSVDFVLLLDGSNPTAKELSKATAETPSGKSNKWMTIAIIVSVVAVAAAVIASKVLG